MCFSEVSPKTTQPTTTKTVNAIIRLHHVAVTNNSFAKVRKNKQSNINSKQGVQNNHNWKYIQNTELPSTYLDFDNLHPGKCLLNNDNA